MKKFKTELVLLPFFVLLIKGHASLEVKNTLKIASDLRPIFLTKMMENGRFDRYKGFVKDFCEELVNILGYQYELVLPQEYLAQGSSSRLNSTISGYWNGVFGMLIRNEVDMAFGDTEVTMERAQVVDFSAPVLTTQFAVIHKLRNSSSPSSFRFGQQQNYWTVIYPFPVAVWVIFVILMAVYLAFIKLHEFQSRILKFLPTQELQLSKKVAKIFMAVWSVLLLTSYMSNYTTLKILSSTGRNRMIPHTIGDIVSQEDVKVGWVARGPVERFFRNTVNELYQKVYMRNIGRDWVSSDSEGINKVLSENGNFAFIMDSLTADFETQLDCSLYKVPHEFGPIRPIAVATPIGSSLRERINQAVLSLSEQGIIEALQKRWFTHTSGKCSATSSNRIKFEQDNATVQEMSPVFIIAVVGLFTATIVGLLEMKVLRRKSNSAVVSSIQGKAKPPRQQQLQQAELLPKFNLEDV